MNSPQVRPLVESLRSSLIRDVANAGMEQADLLPFWFGEPDQPTADYIRAAAIDALSKGLTFYAQTLGMPALRAALSAYLSGLHKKTLHADRIAVTASGTSSLMIAQQALISPGDRVTAVTPVWPNLVEMPKLLGASVTTVPLEFGAQGWQLDEQRLLDALPPGTRALIINSPNNPTGWVASRALQERVLQHCRQHGIWIIADDVYQRVYYDGPLAPSFLDLAEPDDLLISCNSFSKAWRMTGWRLGWLVAPAAVMSCISKLIEFNTTCSPAFVQLAGKTALEQGEADIETDTARLKRGRDALEAGLKAIPGIQVPSAPQGAMYTFFRAEKAADSLAFCKQLLVQTGLGLAPGLAFGPEGEGYLRWCYASEPDRINNGLDRLAAFMNTMDTGR